MNNKLRTVLWVILGLFLAALAGRNGAVALLAIPFLAYLWAGLAGAPGEIRLRATREISPERSHAPGPIRVRLAIENEGAAIARLQVSEALPPDLRLVEGALGGRFALAANGRTELSYTLRGPRGRYAWDTVRLAAGDPFGLFETAMELRAEAHALVLPEPERLHRFLYRPRPAIRSAGPNLSRLPGSGIDFWGVRAYHPGDPLGAIDWRRAARRPGSFFSKAYEREELADIGLLLDARAATNRFRGHADLFEAAVQAAATLAKHFLAAGNRVSLLVLSDRLVRVFPGYGKRQLARILDELAGSALGERVTLATLNHLPVRLFPSHSVIVLISSLLPGDLETVHRLRAEGYQLLLVSPDPGQRVAMDLPEGSYASLARRAASLERAVLLRQIQKQGVPVINWDVQQPFIQTLQAARLARR